MFQVKFPKDCELHGRTATKTYLKNNISEGNVDEFIWNRIEDELSKED
jgi:hypothetical protein